MKYDYEFFEESIRRIRRLACGGPDVSCLMDAPRQLFPDQDFGMTPKLLKEEGWERVILTRSYARKPGRKLERLEGVLRNRLPADFCEFHRLYDEALMTTRTFPIHLWNEARILEEIEMWRDLFPYPVRFFRFCNYWDIYGLYYGLWQVEPNGSEWRVVICSHSQRDDDLDNGLEDEYILASSFHEWLKDFIARDGIPDPYKGIGPEGGFLDPA